MDANELSDRVLIRAIDLSGHLRRGEHDKAMEATIRLRASCDVIALQLWQTGVTAEECTSLVHSSLAQARADLARIIAIKARVAK
jgi:hypothetical protein